METRYEPTPTIECSAYHSVSERASFDDNGEAQFFPPDPVLPKQFCPRATGSSHPASGVRALMWAMLEDAIVCVQKQALTPSRRHQRLAREAEQWILADNTTWIFSFLNVCAALGLEPEYLRARLDQWVKRWSRPARRQQQPTALAPGECRLAA